MASQIIAFTGINCQDLHSIDQVYLPCPYSGSPLVYFVDAKNKLYEVQQIVAGRKSSWMIDRVSFKDGVVRLITAVDPLFIAIPLLEKASEKAQFRTLDDIFSNEHVTKETDVVFDIHRMQTIHSFPSQIHHVCETKEVASNIVVYRLDKDKVLTWLHMKVESLVSRFQNHSALEAVIPNFLAKAETTDDSRKAWQLEAIYLLSKYLTKQWFQKLLESYNLRDIKEEEWGDISNYLVDSSPYPYLKSGSNLPLAPTIKKPRTSGALRTLGNVNRSGMKPLTSFFQKK